MGEHTDISWCHHTFNPWWGCFKVSPGCTHCYAETQSKFRYAVAIWGPPATTPRRLFGDAHWAEPRKWNAAAVAAGERRRVFCASFGDVFEEHPQLDSERERLWHLIADTPALDWLLLTKRPENIAKMLPDRFWPNVWLGTSTENQEYADLRVPQLLELRPRVPVLFLSVEPMLGPVTLHPPAPNSLRELSTWYTHSEFDPTGSQPPMERVRWEYPNIDWVIVGGESGPGHRPFEIEWARQLLQECRRAKVAFHFKQHGGRTHAAGGCLIDGEEVKEFPRPRELAHA